MTRIEKTVKDLGDLYNFYARIKKAKGVNKRKNGITPRSTGARDVRVRLTPR